MSVDLTSSLERRLSYEYPERMMSQPPPVQCCGCILCRKRPPPFQIFCWSCVVLIILSIIYDPTIIMSPNDTYIQNLKAKARNNKKNNPSRVAHRKTQPTFKGTQSYPNKLDKNKEKKMRIPAHTLSNRHDNLKKNMSFPPKNKQKEILLFLQAQFVWER